LTKLYLNDNILMKVCGNWIIEIMIGTAEQLYSYIINDEERTFGKKFGPAILKAAAPLVKRKYNLFVEGCENIPSNKNVSVVADHLLSHDIITQKIAFYLACGRSISALVDLSGTIKPWEANVLGTQDPTFIIRGESEIARSSQERAVKEIERKQGLGRDTIVWGSGVVAPEIHNVMRTQAGGSTKPALKTGTPIIIATEVYVPKDSLQGIESTHIQYSRLFKPQQYTDAYVAANAITEIMREQKRKYIQKYTPGITQAQWSEVRAWDRNTRKHNEHAYWWNTLEYKLAAKRGDIKEMKRIQAMFETL